MNTITHNDIHKDIELLTDSLGDKQRTLVSPYSAVKLSMLWPLSCVSVYSLAALWIALNYQPRLSPFGHVESIFDALGIQFAFYAFSIFLSVFMMISLYGPSLFYLSIPKAARDSSIIISGLKRTVKKLAVCTIILNAVVAISACVINDFLIGAAPFALMASYIFIQVIISAEVTRYGIGPAMKTLSDLARKI